MIFIARKILLHDKVRFAITLIGVTFSVVLIFAQVGVYLGFMQNASSIIDHTDSDIWITSKHSSNFDWARPIPETRAAQAREAPGVLWAKKMILAWSVIRLPNGGSEGIELIGYDPDTGIGGPWRMEAGDPDAVKGGDRIIIDASARRKLGGFEVGDHREVEEKRVEIVGISKGIANITTAPYIFASHDVARKLSLYIGPDQTVFVLVKTAPGADVGAVVQELKRRLIGVDVYTKADFSYKTRRYWTIETGMGLGFLLTAVVGFLVGLVVVSQTIYTSTMEHLREYGTLKAIGASNRVIYAIIFDQAIINAIIGYALGLITSLSLVGGYAKAGIAMVIPPPLMVAIFFATIVMCLSASFISIRKAAQIDPAMVFRA